MQSCDHTCLTNTTCDRTKRVSFTCTVQHTSPPHLCPSNALTLWLLCCYCTSSSKGFVAESKLLSLSYSCVHPHTRQCLPPTETSPLTSQFVSMLQGVTASMCQSALCLSTLTKTFTAQPPTSDPVPPVAVKQIPCRPDLRCDKPTP